jgi:hypothetical protein
MPRLPGNEQLLSRGGVQLRSLREINRLETEEKERLYGALLPPRLLQLLGVNPETLTSPPGCGSVEFIAPAGLGFTRIVARRSPGDQDPLFFLEISDTPYHQIELSFCIITNPDAPRFRVDLDGAGKDNWFSSLGRNIPEELRSMGAGLFPNQVRRGLRLFKEFFPLFQRFVDGLGVDMITAEPLTYDNAIRYEKYGFDYLTGRALMRSINEEFRPGGRLFARLDGSTPFRMPGMERTVRGRSWAIHDGILDEPWDGVRIYKSVGDVAGVNTFPEKEEEEISPWQ